MPGLEATELTESNRQLSLAYEELKAAQAQSIAHEKVEHRLGSER